MHLPLREFGTTENGTDLLECTYRLVRCSLERPGCTYKNSDTSYTDGVIKFSPFAPTLLVELRKLGVERRTIADGRKRGMTADRESREEEERSSMGTTYSLRPKTIRAMVKNPKDTSWRTSPTNAIYVIRQRQPVSKIRRRLWK